MNIVLFQPEIPPNTGNVARQCSVTGASLHLIKPLGFSIDEKACKRAGLDYWKMLDVHQYESLEELWSTYPDGQYHYITKKAVKHYTEVSYGIDDFIVFGRETSGLPKSILEEKADDCLRIPMLDDPAARSLNLSNSVAVILYEALRQNGFPCLI